MQMNAIADYSPMPLQFTHLVSGETHYYSFEVTEIQKQLINYKPLGLDYWCHLTDQRLIFELQSTSDRETLSVLQTIASPVKQMQDSPHSNSVGHQEILPVRAWQISYEAIAAFRQVGLISASYAKIVLRRSQGGGDRQIVLAVPAAPASAQRNRVKEFVQLGKELLHSTRAANVFSAPYDPQAIERFKQELQTSSLPILVDFWAPNCKPCEILNPVIDDIGAQYSDRLKLVKINVEENPAIPMQYGIDCFPAVLLFKAGVKVEQVMGVVPTPLLIKVLSRHLTA